MWLTCSSIGRKFVMALTGICLVLFITFHCLMNGVAIFWPSGYNAVCEFLGANWYALVATIGLAALFIIHIIYALWLTIQNRKARGNDRYDVVKKPAQVEWASQNMLVLGIVVLAFLVTHMIQFWAKMQLAEILHFEHVHEGVAVPPAAGTLFIQIAFSQVYTPIIYIIGFVALWFHMNHGMWSMFQSAGWDNDTWLPRLKTIGCWWTTIVVALFIAEAVVFTVRANSNCFQEQVQEYVIEKASTHALQTGAIVSDMPSFDCCGEVEETVCPDAQPENI
ncbi:MAG: succinate dehydrogenase/fumarate reductase cytochrome b subunit [Duncaniella sp.]|nr:succinate dehydrogenase/fumarate reductase cytochrome b subunit [Duncaniella sp.]